MKVFTLKDELPDDIAEQGDDALDNEQIEKESEEENDDSVA